MKPDHTTTLQELADSLRRSRLDTPALMALDLLAPLHVISSQLALFVRPLVGGTRYAVYAAALAEPESWQALRRLLSRH